MASFTPLWLLPLIFLSIFGAAAGDGEPLPAAFTLSSVRLKSRVKTAPFQSSLSQSEADLRSGKGPPPPHKKLRTPPPPHKKLRPPPPHNYSVKYTMALAITLRIGTPPQIQRMVLDTGSQLMWMPCLNDTTKAPPSPPSPVVRTHTAPYSISRSKSLSFFPCKSCKPNIFRQGVDDYCNDDKTKCQCSSSYADRTVAEGTLVKEKISLANSSSPFDSPAFLMGCAFGATMPEGILGMNSGPFSFISQSKYQTFSYCVPVRRQRVNGSRRNPDGAFYLGANPNSGTFNYAKLLSFVDATIRPPALDFLNYVVNMTGVRIGGVKLDIPAAYFRHNERYEGLTIIDSGTEYTFMATNLTKIIKKEVARRTGEKFKNGYVFRGLMEMCFDGSAAEIGKMIGNMTLEFDDGVDIDIPADRVAYDVTGNMSCLGIGNSDLLPDARNIIGNFHTQNLWVEFDLNRRRVGFGKADCSRALV